MINKNAYNDSQPPSILWKNFVIKKTQKSVAQAAETSKMWSAFQKLLQHLRNSDFQNFMFGTLSIKFSDFLQKILEKFRKLRFFSYQKLLFFGRKSKKTSFFGLGFFREYNFFRLDEYFSKSLCKKLDDPPKNTHVDFWDPVMTHTAEKFDWIFKLLLIRLNKLRGWSWQAEPTFHGPLPREVTGRVGKLRIWNSGIYESFE